MARWLVVVLVVGFALGRAPARAHAQPASVRWDAAFAFAGGVEQIGDELYRQIGAQLQVARWVSPAVAVTAQLELGAAHDRDVVGGTYRAYLGLAHKVVRADDDFLPEVVVAAATGAEVITWDRGPLARWSSVLAIEARTAFAIPRGSALGPLRALGFRAGVQLQGAPAFAPDHVAVRCSGCDPAPATTGAGLELGVVGYLGLAFGL